MRKPSQQLAVAAASLALASAAQAQWSVGWTAAGRTELRVRSLSPSAGDPAVAAAEVELSPSAGLLARSVSLEAAVRYAPSLLVSDQLAPPLLLHRATASAAGHWGEVRISLAEDFAWGTVPFDALLPPVGLPAGTVELTALGPVPFVSSDSRASATVELRRLRLTAGVGYLVAGGLDSALLPLERGPHASLSLVGRPGRFDQLELGASGTLADFSTGSTLALAQAQASWRRELGPLTHLELGAGAGVTRQRLVLVPGVDPGPPVLDVLPVGVAAGNHRLGRRGATVDLRVEARAGPFVDRLVGATYERVQGLAQVTWTQGRELAVSGQAGAAWAVPGWHSPRAGDRIFYAAGTVGWTVDRHLLLRADARVAWLDARQLGLGSQLMWLTAVSATLTEGDFL